jgi:hypothetical protein
MSRPINQNQIGAYKESTQWMDTFEKKIKKNLRYELKIV